MKIPAFLYLLFLLGGGAIPTLLHAQQTINGQENWMTWENFVEEYLIEHSEEEDAEVRWEEILEHLESLKNSPLNINTADRKSLLSIPFLSEAQTDSLLAYRRRKKLFRSLGELMFIRNLSYETRRRLSLFVYAGDTLPQYPSLGLRWWKGKHEVTSRFDLPLYERAGEKKGMKPQNTYTGGALAHTLRYRYRWGRDMGYGVTLQKDAGEPFGQLGCHPYDYTSFHFFYRSNRKQWMLWLGDFNVRWGEGLLLGNSFFSGRLQAVENALKSPQMFKSHTSTNEMDFFRGGAFQWNVNTCWSFGVFGSYRQLDAHITEDGKVSSFKTDGFHRTPTEIANRRTVGNATAGANVTFRKKRWKTAINGYVTHYEHEVSPALRSYNKYYLRGRKAWGGSTHYAWLGRVWSLQGETAVDKSGHWATSNTLKYTPSNTSTITLQLRNFSPKFVAPFGNTLQSGSRVQNEHAILLGTQLQTLRRISLTGYVEFFRHPFPSYRADKASQGMETFAQMVCTTNSKWSWLLRYRMKTKQQNITGYDNIMEYATTHRFRISGSHNSKIWSLHMAADMTIATQQTTSASLGWMLSTRSTWQPSSRFSVAGFAAVFFTDDYASRLYAYEPQLQYAAGFPTFAYHGVRWVGQTSWKPSPWLTLGLRFSGIYYFNRKNIGTGPQLIASSSKNDLSLQCKISF